MIIGVMAKLRVIAMNDLLYPMSLVMSMVLVILPHQSGPAEQSLSSGLVSTICQQCRTSLARAWMADPAAQRKQCQMVQAVACSTWWQIDWYAVIVTLLIKRIPAFWGRLARYRRRCTSIGTTMLMAKTLAVRQPTKWVRSLLSLFSMVSNCAA